MTKYIDWNLVEDSLHTLKPTEGGYTGAKRGVIILPNNQKMFVKIATNNNNKKHINREIEVYKWLHNQKISNIPKLHSFIDGGLLIDDLSSYDFSSRWTDQKLIDVLNFMDNLAAKEFDNSTNFLKTLDDENYWQILADEVDLRQNVQSRLKDEGINLPLEKIKEYATITHDYHKKGSEIVHMDIRADNIAYKYQTREVIAIDWNWCSLGSRKFDQTALLVSVAGHNFDITNYKSRIDKLAALWLAGMWFASFTKPIFEGGDPSLRDMQLSSGLIAYEIAKS